MNVTRGIQRSPAPLGSSYGNVLERVVGVAPAPLLPGENQVDYSMIAGRFVRACRPRDGIEEILIRDAIDLTWEILRLRRVKTGILKASIGDGVERVLNNLDHGAIKAYKLGKAWTAGDKEARKQVEGAIKTAELTVDEIIAKTLESNIDSFERLDRMLASAEARRNNAFREIDRHREALGAAARRSIEEIEDAEFRDVETGEVVAGAKN